MADEPTLSAIVGLFPAVDAVVSSYRDRLDPSAPWGVPAHVTVLFPFVPPHALGAHVEERVEDVVARLRPAEVTFNRVGWFGEDVVYLAPEPDDWFRVATAGIAAAFPDYPPYAGEIDDPTPHLTIGDGAPAAEMQRAAEELAGKLPMQERLDHLALMVGSEAPNSWRVLHEFQLGTW
jgi:hypothetical protein